MASLKDFHAKLKPIIDKGKLVDMVAQEVLNVEPLLKSIKKDEFMHGQRPDGSRIGSYRNLGYANDKAKKNPSAGFPNVDLIDTGSFINSAYLDRGQKSIFNFNFRDSKATSLLDKYNGGMLGQRSIKAINQNEFDKTQKEIIAPRFFRRIKAKIGQ